MEKIQQLYDSREYKKCLAVISMTRSHGGEISEGVLLIESLCLLRLGRANEALPKFRSVYEVAETDKIKCSALMNMGTIGLIKKDVPFADNCFNEVVKYQSSNRL